MRIFKFNEDKLSYERVKKQNIAIILLIQVVLIFLSFYIGTIARENRKVEEFKDTKNTKYNNINPSKHDFDKNRNSAWVDSVFNSYKERANLYISRPIFEGTPFSGEILALCARNAYDSTGIILPLELALSQAIWESGMGRKGKSPENNPYNIGEYDTGTTLRFNSTFDGIQAYYYLMCNNYLKCRTVEELLGGFKNCSERRYATSETYEIAVRNQYYAIKRWIDNHVS
jgi:hypothetical protein